MIKKLIFTDIKLTIIDKLGLNGESIFNFSRLSRDLNIQSWGRTLLFMQLEKDYQITFTMNEISASKTIDDIIDVMYGKIDRRLML